MKKILYVATNEIPLLDLPKRLDEMGYCVYQASLNIGVEKYNESACKRLESVISELTPDYVITYDFVESVSRAAFLKNVPYISWVYDSPQKELYSKDATNPCNYIFVFDEIQRRRLLDIGLKNVYHTTLAIHSAKVIRDITENTVNDGYLYDISFVGQLYKYDSLYSMVEQAPSEIKKDIYELLDNCFMTWKDDISIYNTVSDETITYLKSCDNKIITNDLPYITERFYYESAVISRILANKERVYCLNTLSEIYDLHFFTFDKDVTQLSSNVKIENGAKYDHEVSKIYNKSKINLNITLHCIETGACQRVFDVMAAGGFMISNYQPELAKLFVEDEEIVLFRTKEELMEKVSFYLNHEDQRKAIASAGQRKVLMEFDFSVKLGRLFNLVDNAESQRKDSYLNGLRNELISVADEMIKCNSLDGYSELNNLLGDPKYDVVITRTTELTILKGIMGVVSWDPDWIKQNHSFSVNDLLDLYTTIKHIGWRIEQNVDSKKLPGEIEVLLKTCDYMLLWAWVVINVVDKAEETLCLLAQYLKNLNIVKALALLKAGLAFRPQNHEILISIANIFMHLNMYKETLETIKKIEDPTQEEQQLIKELEQYVEKL